MPTNALLTIELNREPDVVFARQRARQLASELKVDAQNQIRFATAVSEIARNAFQYAGGGRVEFRVDVGPPGMLIARVADSGQGIARLKDVLDGRYISPTGLGLGIVGARRLVDTFDIVSSVERGTEVTLGTQLPSTVRITPASINTVVGALASSASLDPVFEMQQQSQELLRTVAHLRDKQA